MFILKPDPDPSFFNYGFKSDQNTRMQPDSSIRYRSYLLSMLACLAELTAEEEERRMVLIACSLRRSENVSDERIKTETIFFAYVHGCFNVQLLDERDGISNS